MWTNKRIWTLCLVAALAATPLAIGNDGGNGSPSIVNGATTHDLSWLPSVPDALQGDERLLAIASAINAWQLEARQEHVPTLVAPAFDSPLAAMTALAQRHGQAVPLDLAVAVALLPDALGAALTQVIADFIVYEDQTIVAFAGLDVAAILADPETRAGDVRLGGVMVAQERLLVSMVALSDALDVSSARPLVPFAVPGSFHFDLRAVCEDNVYNENVPLLMDDCGNDLYLNNAGGGGLGVIGANFPIAAAMGDFHGDDTYASERAFGVNGGAFVGSGFLFDEAGNDLYDTREANDGVNGGGSVGSGFHVDAGGDNVFRAGGWGTNGGGYIGGRGLLLVSGHGTDVYDGTHEAVNGGGALGNGALWDDGGDDTYVSWSFGVNGGSIGGSGLLYDRLGLDVYDDEEGGSGIDVTIVPKEINGAQFDDA